MKMKAIARLLTITTIASLVLSACGQTAEEQKKSDDQQSDEQGTSEPEGSDMELTTIKILASNDYTSDIKVENWQKYPVAQQVVKDLEEIGIQLELELVDGDNIVDIVNTRMAAGVDLPDLVSLSFCGNSSDIAKWGASGLVYELNDLLEQYDEDGSIKAFYEESAPGSWDSVTQVDGGNYWFSYLCAPLGFKYIDTGVEVPYVGPRSLSIRKDWVEAVGEEVKEVYTPDELLDLLEKIQTNDANGNGLQDEVVYTNISGFNNGFAQAFGLHYSTICGYFDEDDVVFANVLDENYSLYIEFMQELVQRGLYDSVNLSKSREEMISENRVSAAWDYSVWDYEVDLPEVDTETIYYVPIMLDLDGDLSNGYTLCADTNRASLYSYYFIPTASENAEAVIRLMDFVYSEKYAYYSRYGLEGYNYTLDENGNVVAMEDAPSDGVNLSAAAGFGQNVLPPVCTGYDYRVSIEAGYSEKAKTYAYQKYAEDWLYEYSLGDWNLVTQTASYASKYGPRTEEEQEWVNEYATVIDTYIEELNADLILGNKSLDDLDSYLAELDDLGLSTYVEMQQQRHNRAIGVN